MASAVRSLPATLVLDEERDHLPVQGVGGSASPCSRPGAAATHSIFSGSSFSFSASPKFGWWMPCPGLASAGSGPFGSV